MSLLNNKRGTEVNFCCPRANKTSMTILSKPENRPKTNDEQFVSAISVRNYGRCLSFLSKFQPGNNEPDTGSLVDTIIANGEK